MACSWLRFSGALSSFRQLTCNFGAHRGWPAVLNSCVPFIAALCAVMSDWGRIWPTPRHPFRTTASSTVKRFGRRCTWRAVIVGCAPWLLTRSALGLLERARAERRALFFALLMRARRAWQEADGRRKVLSKSAAVDELLMADFMVVSGKLFLSCNNFLQTLLVPFL